MARADLALLFGLSVPLYVLQFYVRALRWRHLTDAVRPIARAPLFRATVIGFMANNVFPLRLGEVVRAWYLAREVKSDAASLFGTVVLERVIDAVVVVGLAVVLLGLRGAPHGEGVALAVGGPLIVSAAVPLGAVLLLRVAPERTIGLLSRSVAWFLPRRTTKAFSELLGRIAQGLGSLQGGRHLLWIAWHSVLIWLLLGMLPFVAGFLALGIDLGSTARTLTAAYVTLVAVGVAVAIPSAPGFFGPYHLACREALSRFGVAEELALALGTLAHAAYWLTSTGLGLAALRLRATRLSELSQAAARPREPAAPP
jgi:uncharacterized protein (TIRG00374 family)